MTTPRASNPSRRQVIATGAGLAAGVGTLAACGTSSSGSSSTPAAVPPAGSTSAAGTSAGSTSAAGASAGAASGGGALAKLADVAVGSAISAMDAGKPIIIAQPSAGKVVAFTAICTHQGCTVAPATGLKLACPCHGSTYDAATGMNTGGPAPAPLAAVPVKVQGDTIVAG